MIAMDKSSLRNSQAAGGFDIHKAVIGERRAVNLLSTDLRTTLTRGNAHTDALPLALVQTPPEETILNAILEKTNGDTNPSTQLHPHSRQPNYRDSGRRIRRRSNRSSH